MAKAISLGCGVILLAGLAWAPETTVKSRLTTMRL
jgi:hypothetical protein